MAIYQRKSSTFQLIIVVVLILGIAGYFVFTQLPTKITSPQLSNSSAPNEDITAPDEMVYVNKEYGFSVKYPKYNNDSHTCVERQNNILSPAPLKVFEVPNTNSFYIADEMVVKVKNKEVGEGIYQNDPEACTVVPNSLDLIMNGYDNGINISKPMALKISYGKVNSDMDLQNVAQTIYPDCYPGSRVSLKDDSSVYQIALVDKNGQKGTPESQNGCFTNFVYRFLYSPKNQLAIITSGFQGPPFNGTNGQSEPIFKFLDK